MSSRTAQPQTALFICLAVCSSAIAGEAPAIDRLFPPGGQRGTSFEVKLTGKAGDGDLKVISEESSISCVLNEKRDSLNLTIDAAARPGIHWLRFVNESGATELKPFLVGLIPELTEADANDRLSEAQKVPAPSVTINGILEKSRDVDTYSVDLRQGQTLVASLLANQILGSPMDAVLQVTNERGSVVAQNNDDPWLDPRVTFTAPADGTWFVRVFAFSSSPNSSIGFAGGADYVYRLTLTTEAVVEYTTPIVRFSGDAETSLRLHGWNISTASATLSHGSHTLATGVALPHFVPSSDVPVLEESQLSAERLLPVPVAVSGRLFPEANDAYLLKGVTSQQISLSVQARVYNSQLDPVLTVFDKDGRQVSEADDITGENADAEMNLTIPADGVYKIVVRDRYQHTSDRFFYVLRCEEVHAACEVTVANTAWMLPADKPLEIPITIARKNGFSEALDVRVEGLPDGVTAECPRSEKDGDSSKAVTLKLSGAPAQGFQGTVRIVYESADSKQLRPVVFNTVDRRGFYEFWLTIPASAPVAAPAPEPSATP